MQGERSSSPTTSVLYVQPNKSRKKRKDEGRGWEGQNDTLKQIQSYHDNFTEKRRKAFNKAEHELQRQAFKQI